MTISGIVLAFICLWIIIGVFVCLSLKFFMPYWQPMGLSELCGDVVLWPWFLFNMVKYGP